MDVTRREFIAASAAAAAVSAAAVQGPALENADVNNERKEGSGMLKGISPVVSPELLKTLAEMGHGDEIVISDAHFPGHTFNPRTLRADGIGADRLLAGLWNPLKPDFGISTRTQTSGKTQYPVSKKRGLQSSENLGHQMVLTKQHFDDLK